MSIIIFKKGDIVKLITRIYLDYPNNPVWGGKYGQVKGHITDTRSDIEVTWDNGTYNSYSNSDLALVNNGHPLTDQFKR